MFNIILFAIILFLPFSSVYDFKVKTIDGKEKLLAEYKGKVILIVNVASECGYTRQYDGLEKLYRKYKDQGLVVLGVPSNDFGGQEPGTNQEIKDFCKSKYDVTFELFEKTTVIGDSKHPLYKYLTETSKPSGEVGWNFEKFLIGKNGELLGRFKSKVEPLSAELTQSVESALAN